MTQRPRLLFLAQLAAATALVHALSSLGFIQLPVPRRAVVSASGTATASVFLSANTAVAAEANDSRNAKIRWGIVGLGDVTAVKSGPAFYKCKGSTLLAVMRRTPGAAKRWVESQPQELQSSVVAYDNLENFLSHPDLDAVYVATPPGAHREVALQVAKAGLPCYVEKPVGRCASETAAIIDAFERSGVPLFTAYVSRSYERTQAIRKLLLDGAVGDRVTSITYQLRGSGGARGMETGNRDLPWRLDAKMSGGGLIMDVGCHVIDRIDYLCGPLTDISGIAENRCSLNQHVEDYVELFATIGQGDSEEWQSIRPSSGATVRCIWDFGNKENGDPLDELIIEGPRGSLRMAAMSPSLPVEVLSDEGEVLQTLSFDAPQHAAQGLIQQVIDELHGLGKAPSRGDNALRTSKVLDNILSTYYGDREDGFWEREDCWQGNPQRLRAAPKMGRMGRRACPPL